MKKRQQKLFTMETLTNETQTTKPVIRTPYNSKFFSKSAEKTKGVSLTLPDQSMSVKEIMQRFASGLPVEGQNVSFFEEEDVLDGIDFRSLDLSERQEYIQQFQEELYQLQQKAAWKKDEHEKKLISEQKAFETVPTPDQQSAIA